MEVIRRKPFDEYSFTACFSGLEGHPHGHITITRLGEHTLAGGSTDWFDKAEVIRLLSEMPLPEFTVVGHTVFQPGNLNALVLKPDARTKAAVAAFHDAFGQIERDGKFYPGAERTFHITIPDAVLGDAKITDMFPLGKIFLPKNVSLKREGEYEPIWTYGFYAWIEEINRSAKEWHFKGLESLLDMAPEESKYGL